MFSYLRASRSVQDRAKVVGFARSRRGRREKKGRWEDNRFLFFRKRMFRAQLLI